LAGKAKCILVALVVDILQKAFYLQIDNLDALNKVVDWYANL
jgi:hypothetical protein